MKLTADAKRRVVLPLPIRKGDILLLDEQGRDRWLLTRIKLPKAPAQRKLKGKTVAEILASSSGSDIKICETKAEKIEEVKL